MPDPNPPKVLLSPNFVSLRDRDSLDPVQMFHKYHISEDPKPT